MKNNPLINALLAGMYILLVVGIIYSLQSPNTPDTIFAPIFLLSLFTLSAAVMAFIFFYQPFKLYFDNHRKEALTYFMKTVGYFALLVLISFSILLYFRAPDAITFPKGGEELVQGQSYELTWTGGREETLQLFLIDTSLKDQGASVSISDKVNSIPNIHSYVYKIPENLKPGTYEIQIGKETSNRFEIVAPHVAENPDGEADPSRMKLDMNTWVWVEALYNDERVVTPKKAGAFTLTFAKNNTFTASTDCNQMGGTYTTKDNQITFSSISMTKMACEGSQEIEFKQFLENTSSYHFTGRGQLILDLKFDSGSVIFR